MKPLYIKKNGQVEKVTGAFAMPASYPAERVAYDNTNSGLSADDAQGAIDEIVGDVNDKVDKVNGKELSTNDYDNTDKAKVDKIDTTTTSISGNPISISGLKANQLAVNPIITFEPIQAGSGTPSPSNIRAISGYDKIEVLSCGKNLCDNSKNVSGGYYEPSGWQSGSNFATSGLIPVAPNTIYYGSIFSKTEQRVGEVVYTLWSDENTCYQQITTTPVTTDANTKYVRIRNFNAQASYITGNNYLYQLEKGSTASTTFYPYNKATSISESLGQTVYGGSLDVRTGLFTVTHAYVDLGSLTWTYNSSVTTFIASDLPKYAKINGNANPPDIVCSQYDKIRPNGYNAGQNNTISLGNTDPSIYVWIKDSRYTDATTFGNAMSGVQLVYKLATPLTIQLTPREIILLSIYAYVSTNGTSIALDYHNGELASLGDVSQLGETVNELGDNLGIEFITKRYEFRNITLTNATDIPFEVSLDGYETLGLLSVQVAMIDRSKVNGIIQQFLNNSDGKIYLTFNTTQTISGAYIFLIVLYRRKH